MIKHQIQQRKNECGLSCLKMFYDFFEVEISEEELRSKVEIEEQGISIENMLKVLSSLSLFKAYEVNALQLKNMTPCIALLRKNKMQHYVVIWREENGYFYVSDPALEEIKKIKAQKLFKFFSSYVIFNQKREVIIPKKEVINIPKGPFQVPYVLLTILESLLITYSMFYLFSIEDFAAFKIYYFLIIMFLNFVISILKNLSFNMIQKKMEKEGIDKRIKSSFMKGSINSINELKMKIRNGYEVKNYALRILANGIPSLIFLIVSLVYFYFMNLYVFISSIIVFLILFLIEWLFEYLKNKKMKKASYEEMELDIYVNKGLSKEVKEEILAKVKEIKKDSYSYLALEQVNNLIIFAIKQFSLMIILMFLYLEKVEIYSIFVVTFFFYSFEGVINLAQIISLIKDKIIEKRLFLKE